MYKEYFGFSDLPFSIAPDPRYLYMSTQHREALAHLLYGVNSNGGFVLLTGEVGTGKTTVCRCLLEQMPGNVDVAFIINPKLGVDELLASICDELGIQYPEGNKSIKVFVDRINSYLLDVYSKGRKTVLIIEEAQNLSDEVLEQLRLLTNLETNERKLLQIIMIGQPELMEKLSRDSMRQLSQRIVARYHIGPLSEKEVNAYVNHRLSVAGYRDRLFTPNAIRVLYRLSRGIPRLINMLCDRSLLGAYAHGKRIVDKKMMNTAAKEVMGGKGINSYSKVFKWSFIVLFLIVAVSIIFLVRYDKTESISRTDQEIIQQSQEWDILKFTDEHQGHNGIEKAFSALFKQWNILYQAGDGAPCLKAKSEGLRCLDGRISMDGLIRLNRPAVLKLFDDSGKDFYVALIALKDQTATLATGDDVRTINLDRIKQFWFGDFIMIWKAPFDYQNAIYPGQKGKEVKWLSEQLSIINGRAIQSMQNDIYEEELVKQVKMFQLSSGLIPDGVVGPQTIIQIVNAVDNNGPLLSK